MSDEYELPGVTTTAPNDAADGAPDQLVVPFETRVTANPTFWSIVWYWASLAATPSPSTRTVRLQPPARQLPPAHTGLAIGHTLPQVPQLAVSVSVLAQ